MRSSREELPVPVPSRRSVDRPAVLRPEKELRSVESRPLAVRPPDVAPSRKEPELGREEPGREDEDLPAVLRPDALAPREDELSREPDEGRPEDGREGRELDEELRSLGRPCERDDDLSAGMAAPILKLGESDRYSVMFLKYCKVLIIKQIWN